MKDTIIIGLGQFAKLMTFYLEEFDQKNVVAYSVNEDYITGEKTFLNKSIVSFEKIEQHFSPKNHEVFLAIGYKHMNILRKHFFEECTKKGYEIASFIHPTSYVSPNAILGEGNIILENCLIQPFVKIGKGNLLWYNVSVAHDDAIGNFNTICGGTTFSGNVIVGDNCFFGNSCCISNSVTIKDYTLCGMGTIIKKNSSEYDVIVPPRSITLKDKSSLDIQI